MTLLLHTEGSNRDPIFKRLRPLAFLDGAEPSQREFFIDNPLVRILLIIEMSLLPSKGEQPRPDLQAAPAPRFPRW